MKYVSEEAIAKMKRVTSGVGSEDAQADAEDARYRNQSRRGGPLEVFVVFVESDVQFTDGKTSSSGKRRKQEGDRYEDHDDLRDE